MGLRSKYFFGTIRRKFFEIFTKKRYLLMYIFVQERDKLPCISISVESYMKISPHIIKMNGEIFIFNFKIDVKSLNFEKQQEIYKILHRAMDTFEIYSGINTMFVKAAPTGDEKVESGFCITLEEYYFFDKLIEAKTTDVK